MWQQEGTPEQAARAGVLFANAVHPTRGRALRASRRIKPGETLLREEAAVYTYGGGGGGNSLVAGGSGGYASMAECHEQLAQMVLALHGPDATLRGAIAGLHAAADQMRAAEPQLLAEVREHATPAVRRLVAARMGEAAVAAEEHVDAAAVERCYCQLLLNAMAVTRPDNLEVVGSALFPLHAASLNHDNCPNAWCCFLLPPDALQGGGGGAPPTLLLRALAPIAAGDELTIAYVDTATLSLHAVAARAVAFVLLVRRRHRRPSRGRRHRSRAARRRHPGRDPSAPRAAASAARGAALGRRRRRGAGGRRDTRAQLRDGRERVGVGARGE